ncbi:MAG: hypothetical protein H7345_18700 [Rubritepida sp.]|nr:hypothetical protein [Rubritepida sp.]
MTRWRRAIASFGFGILLMPLGVVTSQLPYMLVLFFMMQAYPQPAVAFLPIAKVILSYGTIVSAPINCLLLPVLSLKGAKPGVLMGSGAIAGAWPAVLSALMGPLGWEFFGAMFGFGGVLAGGISGWLFARVRPGGK